MIIASAEIATRNVHWIAALSLIAAIIFLLAVVYLTARSLMTKPDALSTAPYHVQRARGILIWMAIVAPMLTMVGGSFELYDRMYLIGMTGIDVGTPYLLLMAFIAFPVAGFTVSLAALAGIGLIFFRHR